MVADKRQKRSLNWCNSWRESEVDALSILRSLLEAVLEHAVDDPTDTERWLNDVRRELLLLRRLCLLSEADHLLSQDKLLVVDLDLELFAAGQSLGQLFLLIICRVFKEFSDHLLILLKLLADDLLVEHGVRHSVCDWLR